MTEKWIVLVKVNDEPPNAPEITGAFGEFNTEEEAEDWAASQYVRPDVSFLVIPLAKP